MLATNMFFMRSGAGFGPAPGWAGTDPVTVLSKRPNATGREWEIVYSITGDSGYTLLTRLRKIVSVLWDDTTITGCSIGSENGVITFTSSGAFTATEVTVIGH